MSIVYQKNKKTGVTYAYEATSVWVPELKQPRSKRVYLGKVAPDGSIIPPAKRKKADSTPPENTEDIEILRQQLAEKDKLIQEMTEENARLKDTIERIQGILNSLADR